MSETELVRYDAMCQAIAAAYQIDEVKHIRDKAMAIAVYAKQAKNVEAERQACEIRLRAERRTGELLREMPKAKPGPPPVNPSQRASDPKPLSDLGISHTQSSRWQKLADIPEDTFERAIREERPSTNGVLTAAAPPPKTSSVDPRALWLWGRLLDFERQGLLEADPNALAGTMIEHMRETTHDLAPRVAAWLGRIR